jgi:uncharacterized protein with HEPN domain
LAEELKEVEADIPWKAIAGIGNVLRHEYHSAYPDVLWETCSKDLASLKAAVARIRRKLLLRRT